MDQIINADDYIRDFEELAKESCHSFAERMVLSVFQEFSIDTVCSVYLDSDQVKGNQQSYEFTFSITMEDNIPVVCYTGYL